jgi:hypothetical protein
VAGVLTTVKEATQNSQEHIPWLVSLLLTLWAALLRLLFGRALAKYDAREAQHVADMREVRDRLARIEGWMSRRN